MANDITEIFSKASNLVKPCRSTRSIYKTPEEWENYPKELEERQREFEARKIRDGVRKFKRRVLGICGSQSLKRLEELEVVFQSLNIASKKEEGEQVIKSLLRKKLYYNQYDYLLIEEVRDQYSDDIFRISKHFDSLAYKKDHPPSAEIS